MNKQCIMRLNNYHYPQLAMNSLYLQVQKFYSQQVNAKQTAQGNKYLIHELQEASFSFELQKAKHSLTGHHLSIHQKDDPENPYVSAYHYTAYFSPEIQLHVYYGRKDEVIAIQLSSLTTKKPLILSQEVEKELINLAIKHSTPFVRACRIKADTQFKLDKAELDQLIRKQNPVASLHQNREIITRIIACLNQIIAYYPTASLIRQRSYYKGKYRELSQALSASTSASSTKLDELIDTEILDEQNPLTQILEGPNKTNYPTRVKTVLTPEIALLMEKMAEYKALPSEEYERFIPEIIKFYNTVYQNAVLSEDKEYYVTTEDKNNLDSLIHEVEEQRLSLFQHFLVRKQFTQALHLMSDSRIEMLDLHKFIQYTLNSSNHEILDFLLSNYTFPINTSEFNSLSPAMYCFIRSKEKPSIAKCFWVLVKHGASLEERVPETSLSIVGTILLTPNHPLKPQKDDLDSLPSPIAQIEKDITPERKASRNPPKIRPTLRAPHEARRNLQEAVFNLCKAVSDLSDTQSGHQLLDDLMKKLTITPPPPPSAPAARASAASNPARFFPMEETTTVDEVQTTSLTEENPATARFSSVSV